MSDQQVKPRLEDELVWVVARVNHQLEQKLAERLSSRGLPIEQYWILQALCEMGPTAVSQLAEMAHAGRPNTTKILDRMVAAGLVCRAPDHGDRRRINILATDEGRLLYEDTAQIAPDIEQTLREKLPLDQLTMLKSLLKNIV